MMGIERREDKVQRRLLYVSNLSKMGSSGLISVGTNLGRESEAPRMVMAVICGGSVMKPFEWRALHRVWRLLGLVGKF